VPAYLLSQPDLVARWAGQLSRLQLLDPQPRVLGEHVLHEHEAWLRVRLRVRARVRARVRVRARARVRVKVRVRVSSP